MIDQYKIIALLPMKANSTRVPNKNFRIFSGKPLFRWILDTLLSINEIDLIVINTDAKNILLENNLPLDSRIIIRDRRHDLCGDNVSMNKIIENDIESIKGHIYLMTHTTNPLLSKESILAAVNTFLTAMNNDVDSLFTVDKIQARFYRNGAEPINHDLKNLIPTQELEPWYKENSNLYLFTADSFSKTKARIGVKPIMYESSLIDSVDIDTQDDWDYAEMIANSLGISHE
jgi:CMP-N-acetylneuraminic acid synthetase